MKDEYDMSEAKRGAVIPATGKTRLTLYLDDAVFEALRRRAEAQGIGYQTLIGEALTQFLTPETAPVNAQTLRRILREELERTA
jgi:predicted DNA binding CopG/RHH family protein